MAADLSITAANIDFTNAGMQYVDPNVTAAAALTAAQVVYLTSSNTIDKCNTTTATLANALGVVVNTSVSSGQQMLVARSGQVVTGMPTMVAGTVYYVSGTGGTHASSAAGGICTFADLTTGEYVTILGVALTTTTLYLNIYATGITKA